MADFISEINKGRKEHEAALGYSIGEKDAENAANFTGDSYISALSSDLMDIETVTFEPGSRTNWYMLHADKAGGQVIICVAGRGFYQEQGKDAVEMNPGDSMSIPTGVICWHGAAPESWVSYIVISVPGENTSTEYFDPVFDGYYDSLKRSEAEAALSEESVMNTAIMHISINEDWPYGTMKKYWLEGDRLAIEYETGKVLYYQMEDGYWEPEGDWVVLPE